MDATNWNKKVKEALDRTEFMAISTIGSDGCWTAPVAFAYSEKMELFFISMIDAKHSQNIITNGNVSVAVFKTERFPDGEVLGLQLKGVASLLSAPEDIARAAKYYFGRSPKNDEFRSLTSEKDGSKAVWQFFEVVPIEAWCFDSRSFGEDRVKLPLNEIYLTDK